MFPKAVDQHKPQKPLIPNGLGVFFVLISVVNLFLFHYFDYERALPLAGCILFGGFMGLLDDWIDLRWRYKAFLPIIAAIPLSALASDFALRTSISVIFTDIDFGIYYYFLIIPLIVTVTTNTVNQLGGLNGLETICPSIIMAGLMIASTSHAPLLYVPLVVTLSLAYFNFQGKIFVGNTGSFAFGITLASFAIIADIKFVLLFSIAPYIFNSAFKLLNFFIFKTKPELILEGSKLQANHRRSLITLIGYKRPLTERQIVSIISLLFVLSTVTSVLVWILL
ncbi:MAG: hypothetical protein JSV51_06705 [Candidatus Bathyarchaeota archaeon]|nr:MAG: hypothetical protein JSV51_06705 [Candidatus Bathyarchaeota archaeon]